MATRRSVIGSGAMGVLEFGGRVLEERGADMLVFMRMTRDVATCMYSCAGESSEVPHVCH